MPRKETIEKAEQARKEGKAPSTQAGEFVREEIEHIRKGKHGARSTKQAIAIGLSKARRAGVKLPPPAPGTTSEETRRKAERDFEDAQSTNDKAVSRKRSHAASSALEREPHKAASRQALSRHAHGAAKKRSASSRSAAAKKAAATKGAAGRSAAARKAARTRAQASR